MMPFTYSITDGIAFGFISYAFMKIGTGKIKEIHPSTYLVTLLFILKFFLVD